MKYKINTLLALCTQFFLSLIPSICKELPQSFTKIGLTESILSCCQGARTTCGVIDLSTTLAGPFMPASYTITFSLYSHKEDLKDEDHGLRVATILAGERPPATNSGYGFIGVAPRANIISYDGNSLSGFHDALLNPNIFCINISLSIETDQAIAYVTENFIPEAYKRNIILVFSAANDGVPLTTSTHNGISWPEALCKSASKYPNVIIAGGVTHINDKYPWGISGSGNFISKYQPFPRYAFITAPSTYVLDDLSYHGTSYSAPLISGALCILKEIFPSFNNITLATLLMLSGSKFQTTQRVKQDINIQECLKAALSIFTIFHIHDSEKSAASCREKQEYLHSNLPLEPRFSRINELVCSTKKFVKNLLIENISDRNNLIAELSNYLNFITTQKIKPLNNALNNLISQLKKEKALNYKKTMHDIIGHIIHHVISMIEELIIFTDPTINSHMYEQIVEHIHTWEYLVVEKNDLNIGRAIELGKQSGLKIDKIVRTHNNQAIELLIDEALSKNSW